MEDMDRWQIPSFGNWGDFCDELPITQCFESARPVGFLRGHFLVEEDLFKVPSPPLIYHQKPKKMVEKQNLQQQCKEKQWKQGKVSDGISPKRRTRAPKAVDEDLYKIPPELIYQKPRRVSHYKKRRLWRDFWSRCLGLNCIP